ncbi:MAG: acyl-CoA dehydrogenase, partial [Alphaproteobacteria bacterium]
MAFSAPIRDIRFVLEDIVQFGKLAETGVFEDLGADLVEAVLTESGRLAGEVMAPLNVIGDRQGAVLEDGAVRMAPGFAAAYRQYVAGGWNGIAADTAYGGQGLPYSLSIACSEMVYAANLSLTLCPLLTAGAVEALSTYGSQEQKSLYLAKLVTGE